MVVRLAREVIRRVAGFPARRSIPVVVRRNYPQ